jgi:uncharacterized protein with PQ loop repeat
LRDLLRRIGLERHRHPIDRLADLNALASGFALLPQVLKSFSTRSVEDLSIATLAVIAGNSAVWLAYALHRRLPPLLVSSILNLSAASALLFLAWRL